MKLPLREFSDIVAALRTTGAQSSSNENRNASRMEITTRIHAHILEAGQIKRSYSLLTRDISLTGMGVLQSIALPTGAEVLVELPRSSGPIPVRGVVIRSETLADGIVALGIEFTSLADAQMAAHLAKLRTDEQARVQRAMMQSAPHRLAVFFFASASEPFSDKYCVGPIPEFEARFALEGWRIYCGRWRTG